MITKKIVGHPNPLHCVGNHGNCSRHFGSCSGLLRWAKCEKWSWLRCTGRYWFHYRYSWGAKPSTGCRFLVHINDALNFSKGKIISRLLTVLASDPKLSSSGNFFSLKVHYPKAWWSWLLALYSCAASALVQFVLWEFDPRAAIPSRVVSHYHHAIFYRGEVFTCASKTNYWRSDSRATSHGLLVNVVHSLYTTKATAQDKLQSLRYNEAPAVLYHSWTVFTFPSLINRNFAFILAWVVKTRQLFPNPIL